MMEGGAGVLQRLAKRVEMRLKFEQEMISLSLEELAVNVVAEPAQQRLEVGLNQRENEVGYTKR
jgi:hypothetical protein